MKLIKKDRIVQRSKVRFSKKDNGFYHYMKKLRLETKQGIWTRRMEKKHPNIFDTPIPTYEDLMASIRKQKGE